MSQKIVVNEKEITIYPAVEKDQPLILLNNFSGDGKSIRDELDKLNAPDMNFVSIGNLNQHYRQMIRLAPAELMNFCRYSLKKYCLQFWKICRAHRNLLVWLVIHWQDYSRFMQHITRKFSNEWRVCPARYGFQISLSISNNIK